MHTNHTRMLLYDGDCPLCRSMVAFLRRIGLTRQVNVIPWQQANITDESLGERIRSEIIMVDPESGETAGGIDVISQLFRSATLFRTLAVLLDFPFIRRLAEMLYTLIALNRRILSPPMPYGIPCACDPPENPPARRQLIWLLVCIILLPLLMAPGSAYGTIAACLFGAAGVGLSGGRKHGRYALQALVVAALWSLIMTPFLVTGFASGYRGIVMVGSVLAALITGRSWHYRAKALQLPGWLPGLWLVCQGLNLLRYLP